MEKRQRAGAVQDAGALAAALEFYEDVLECGGKRSATPL
jgi:hypothetical protein